MHYKEAIYSNTSCLGTPAVNISIVTNVCSEVNIGGHAYYFKFILQAEEEIIGAVQQATLSVAEVIAEDGIFLEEWYEKRVRILNLINRNHYYKNVIEENYYIFF